MLFRTDILKTMFAHEDVLGQSRQVLEPVHEDLDILVVPEVAENDMQNHYKGYKA